jgi:hypothetical protein
MTKCCVRVHGRIVPLPTSAMVRYGIGLEHALGARYLQRMSAIHTRLGTQQISYCALQSSKERI